MAKKKEEHFFIWWDEFDSKNLPNLCINCGKKAKWHKYRFEMWQMDTATKAQRKKDTQVPFCSEHQTTNMFIGRANVNATACTAEGVWTSDIGKDFIAALLKHRKKEAKEWREENEADPADVPNERLPPGLREEPEFPDMELVGLKSLVKAPMFWIFAVLLAIVLLVMLCGVCGVVAMAIFGLTR